VGFAGLAFLLDPFGAGSVDRVGAVAALLSAFAWAAGSLYSRGAPLPRRPLVSAGLAALCGGVLLMLVAAGSGELGDARFSWEALVAVAYLIVFGTLIGFTAYVWLLRVAPTSLVSTYAYVNPIVAVVLGWALLGEQITVQTVVAATAIVVSVTLILRSSGAALARGRSLRRSVTAAEAITR
jgi:drug/metabolite transporter (DMT)-like permease